MMKQLTAWLTGMRRTLAWNAIVDGRQRMAHLIEQGEPYTSARLIRLDERNLRNGRTLRGLNCAG